MASIRPTLPGRARREPRAALWAFVVRWLLIAVIAGLLIGATLRLLA